MSPISHASGHCFAKLCQHSRVGHQASSAAPPTNAEAPAQQVSQPNTALATHKRAIWDSQEGRWTTSMLSSSQQGLRRPRRRQMYTRARSTAITTHGVRLAEAVASRVSMTCLCMVSWHRLRLRCLLWHLIAKKTIATMHHSHLLARSHTISNEGYLKIIDH